MQTPKKKLLTPERVNEVADSLLRQSETEFRVGKKIREEKKKTGTYVNKYMSDKYVDSVAQDYWKKSTDNLLNASRYRRLAEAAKKIKNK